jgi:phage shock protein C
MDYKKLYRSRKETLLGGVCGGLGVYLKIDPTVVRLLFVVLQLVGWPMILVYLILWIITPLEPHGAMGGSNSSSQG